jgi:hypothetical protein
MVPVPVSVQEAKVTFPTEASCQPVLAGSSKPNELWVKAVGIKQVEVYDVTGSRLQVVGHTEGNSYRFHVAAGIYVVKVELDTGKSYRLKVLVR